METTKQQEETKKAWNICITGAAGQIAYAFIPLLCSGQIFGQKV